MDEEGREGVSRMDMWGGKRVRVCKVANGQVAVIGERVIKREIFLCIGICFL